MSWEGLAFSAALVLALAVAVAAFVTRTRTGGLAALRGSGDDRWPLERARRELTESARGAATRGGDLARGLFYADGTATLWVACLLALPAPFEVPDEVALAIAGGLAVVACGATAKLVLALARARGERLEPLPVSRAMVDVLGLFVATHALFAAPVLLLLVPLAQWTRALEPAPEWQLVTATLLVLFATVTLAWGGLLHLLHQLALPSCLRTQRGTSAALTHAWRLLRNDPGAGLRAALGDAPAVLATLIAGVAPIVVARLLPDATPRALLGGAIGGAVVLGALVRAASGVTRARYWGRAYPALGGIDR